MDGQWEYRLEAFSPRGFARPRRFRSSLETEPSKPSDLDQTVPLKRATQTFIAAAAPSVTSYGIDIGVTCCGMTGVQLDGFWRGA